MPLVIVGWSSVIMSHKSVLFIVDCLCVNDKQCQINYMHSVLNHWPLQRAEGWPRKMSRHWIHRRQCIACIVVYCKYWKVDRPEMLIFVKVCFFICIKNNATCHMTEECSKRKYLFFDFPKMKKEISDQKVVPNAQLNATKNMDICSWTFAVRLSYSSSVWKVSTGRCYSRSTKRSQFSTKDRSHILDEDY